MAFPKKLRIRHDIEGDVGILVANHLRQRGVRAHRDRAARHDRRVLGQQGGQLPDRREERRKVRLAVAPGRCAYGEDDKARAWNRLRERGREREAAGLQIALE